MRLLPFTVVAIVLGIASPRGPALEPGAEAGQVKAPRGDE